MKSPAEKISCLVAENLRLKKDNAELKIRIETAENLIGRAEYCPGCNFYMYRCVDDVEHYGDDCPADRFLKDATIESIDEYEEKVRRHAEKQGVSENDARRFLEKECDIVEPTDVYFDPDIKQEIIDSLRSERDDLQAAYSKVSYDLEEFKSDIFSAIEAGLGTMCADPVVTIRSRGSQMRNRITELEAALDEAIRLNSQLQNWKAETTDSYRDLMGVCRKLEKERDEAIRNSKQNK